MPRLKRFVSYEQQRWEDELRDRYGGMMTRQQIGVETGHANNRRWQAKFVEDLISYGDGIRRRYRVADVAEKLARVM